MTRMETTIPAMVPLFGTSFETAPTAVAVASPFDCVDDGRAAVWEPSVCAFIRSRDKVVLTCDEPAEDT